LRWSIYHIQSKIKSIQSLFNSIGDIFIVPGKLHLFSPWKYMEFIMIYRKNSLNFVDIKILLYLVMVFEQ